MLLKKNFVLPNYKILFYRNVFSESQSRLPILQVASFSKRSYVNRKPINFNDESNRFKDNETDNVKNFYCGKSVFITGGTGFVGKVAIEKLLYSCPEVNKLYVLIRPKEHYTVQQRMEDLLSAPLFERLKSERPQDLQKVVPITGDVTFKDLGISEEEKSSIVKNVSVVINASGKIDFDDCLGVSFANNFEGNRNVHNFSRQISGLQVFTHISTAYCHCNRQVIEEKVYPPPAEISKVYEHLKKHGNDNNHVKKILNGLPNTYILSKALFESYLKENAVNNVYTCIIRPSIILSKAHEPCVGWLDGWQGATALMYGAVAGGLRVMRGDSNATLDIIPVDFVANTVIVASAKIDRDMFSVYNCCTSSFNPINLKTLKQYMFEEAEKQNIGTPYRSLIWLKSERCAAVSSLLIEEVPAYVADSWRRLKGKRPKYTKLHTILNSVRKVMEYFTTHSWEMKTNRTRELYKSLSPADQQQFPFDPTLIEWKTYVSSHCAGIKRYLLKIK